MNFFINSLIAYLVIGLLWSMYYTYCVYKLQRISFTELQKKYYQAFDGFGFSNAQIDSIIKKATTFDNGTACRYLIIWPKIILMLLKK